MPIVLALISGTLTGYGTYVGWLAAIGITAGSLGIALTVGAIAFLIGLLFGIFILVIGDL